MSEGDEPVFSRYERAIMERMVSIQPIIYIIEPYGGSIRQQNPNMPHVYFDDASVTRGDGVFESLLVDKGRACNVDRHLDRFTLSAQRLELPEVHREQWRNAAAQAAAEFARHDETGNAQARMTWTLSRGRAKTRLATAWLIVTPLSPSVIQKRDSGVTVMTTSRGYTFETNPPEWFPLGVKTVSKAENMAAVRYARAHGIDDVIFTNGDEILEGATSTVVIVKKNRRLRTPPAGADILAGTSVAAVEEVATQRGWKFKTRRLQRQDLFDAQSVWLISSTRMAVRVTELDGITLPGGELDAEFQALATEALTAE